MMDNVQTTILPTVQSKQMLPLVLAVMRDLREQLITKHVFHLVQLASMTMAMTNAY